MRLVAIVNRTAAQAERAYREAGVESSACGRAAAELDQAIEAGDYAVTDDPKVALPVGPDRGGDRNDR